VIVAGHNVFIGHCPDCEWPVVVTRGMGERWPLVECPKCEATYSLGALLNGVCYATGGQVRD